MLEPERPVKLALDVLVFLAGLRCIDRFAFGLLDEC
jgi:hypothetical protein